MMKKNKAVHSLPPVLTDNDIYLFNEGTHHRLYQALGAHPLEHEGVHGTYFAVWAPDAQYVSVIGSFNDWQCKKTPLKPRASSGIWETFVPQLGHGELYKFHIASRYNNHQVDKADPFGRLHEIPPCTASVIWHYQHEWQDQQWMRQRRERNKLHAPISIYEVHLGSWKRVPEEGFRSLSYREMASELVTYVKEMGFTHVEFLPVMEHPYYASWGYQGTGYFAPCSRYGTPDDFMYLVDKCHQNNIGVLIDWVPAHFATDEHGLGFFDGTHLYEHADPRLGVHPDWKTFIFNYGRNEVQSFLISSALVWLDRFHVDGLRVDGVASMLYLDYSRAAGEWIPNAYGGRENLEATSLLRKFNVACYDTFPDIQNIAEESTAWPMVSRPTDIGGLGFGLKWDMGWMHDTLRYMSRESVYRRHHHHELTFRMIYAFQENFVLPLSHDEVVHGKASLINKMPGDDWQKFANLRLMFAYMFGQPGKKLLFMGGEIAQWNEWNHDGSVEWALLDYPRHKGIQQLVRDLNGLYRQETALHQQDVSPEGFCWIDCNDAENSVYSFCRFSETQHETILILCNMTPIVRQEHKIGVPLAGIWKEILNTDAKEYGGSGVGNQGQVVACATPYMGQPCYIEVCLPPLAAIYLKYHSSKDER